MHKECWYLLDAEEVVNIGTTLELVIGEENKKGDFGTSPTLEERRVKSHQLDVEFLTKVGLFYRYGA